MRVLREERGGSQEVLEDLAGVHRTCVGSVERGGRNIMLGLCTVMTLVVGVHRG